MSQSKRLPPLVATFHPQADQNGYVVPVDPMDPEHFDVSAEYAAMGREKAFALKSNTDASDALKEASAAPDWVKQWSGPFWIEVPEPALLRAFFNLIESRNQALEFEINEIHIARHRITRDQLTDDQWAEVTRLEGHARADYLMSLHLETEYIDDSLEYSRTDAGSLRNVTIVTLASPSQDREDDCSPSL